MSNQEQPLQIEQHKSADDVERRTVTDGLEVRSMDGGKKKIKGYALKWNQRYNMGWFTEEIHRDALRGADMGDVRALFNHDPNAVLGRTTAGTLRLAEDETGLLYEIDLPDTQLGRDLAASIERGDISQSSWGFTLRVDDNSTGDEWQRDGGKDHRVIKAVRQVWDVSPVTFPANPNTYVAWRSLDSIRAEQEAKEQAEQKINQRSAQIRVLLAQYPNK